MKKIKRILAVVIVFSIISCIFSSTITVSYALSYEEDRIGNLLNPESDLKNLERCINNLIVDGSTQSFNDFKIVEDYSFYKKSSDIDINKILIKNGLKSGYCLEINNNNVYWSESKSKIESKIEELKELLSEKYGISKIPDYKIKPCLFRNEKPYQLSDVLMHFGFQLEKVNTVFKQKEIEKKTVYVYGLSETIYDIGQVGKIEEEIKEKYINEDKVLEETINTRIVVPVKQEIIITPDKSKIDYNYDASILYGLTDFEKNFINKILPAALIGQEKYHIPVSLTLAQAILESNWGEYNIENNLYGFKAYDDWTGKSVKCETSEFENGEYVKKYCYFRTYNSFEESVMDYLKLLGEGELYTEIPKSLNYLDAAAAIGNSKYSTCPTYGEKILNIIETYNLFIWDNL